MSNYVTKAELEKGRENCRISLKVLCTIWLWHTQAVKDWAVPLHDDLSRFLKRPSKKKLILLPRNHLKSAIVTQGWTIQQMLKNYDTRILISCNTWENARKFLGAIERFLVQSPLRLIFGDFQGPLWNQDECTVKQRKQILVAPTWATTGTEKQQTSQHYDVIVHDDLVDEENSRTPELREKTKQVYRNSWDLLEPNGQMVVIGTRWHQDDLYSDLVNDPTFDKMIRTAYVDDQGKPAFTRTPHVAFPQKFTVQYLEELARPKAYGGKGAYAFASQYLNNPIAEEASDFKAEQIKFYDPATPHPTSLYLTVDPAVSLGRDADFTGMIVAGQFSDRRIRVVDRIRQRLVPSDLVDKVFELVQKWGLHRVGIETFAFQKTLKYEIQRQQRERGTFFSIDELGKRNTGRGEQILSKEARIRRLQPYFEQGLVEIRSDMSDLQDELLAFPRGKHDDLIDALAYQLDNPYISAAIQPSIPESQIVHWSPPTWRMVARNTWNKSGSSLLQRYFSDLKTQTPEPNLQ